MDNLLAKLKKISIPNIMNNAMDNARIKCEEYAKELAPFDTGALHDSISSMPIDNGFIIDARIRYAVFNEYGSIYTPAGTVELPLPAKYYGFRPFMRPAIIRVQSEIPKLFKQGWKNIVG